MRSWWLWWYHPHPSHHSTPYSIHKPEPCHIMHSLSFRAACIRRSTCYTAVWVREVTRIAAILRQQTQSKQPIERVRRCRSCLASVLRRISVSCLSRFNINKCSLIRGRTSQANRMNAKAHHKFVHFHTFQLKLYTLPLYTWSACLIAEWFHFVQRIIAANKLRA